MRAQQQDAKQTSHGVMVESVDLNHDGTFLLDVCPHSYCVIDTSPNRVGKYSVVRSRREVGRNDMSLNAHLIGSTENFLLAVRSNRTSLGRVSIRALISAARLRSSGVIKLGIFSHSSGEQSL